jgi:hypothetical protein
MCEKIDNSKIHQRNIRIPPDLWDYVRSIAPKGHTRLGDCSSVIRDMIRDHQQRRVTQ